MNSSLENRSQNIAIHWFRQDLRLADNPALAEAISSGQLLPIFILDEESENAEPLGGASRCWLHHSLQSLNEQLQGRLQLYRGKAEDILHRLCKQHSITSVHWNRCYEPWRIARDTQIKNSLKTMDVRVHSHNGSLLWEPWQVLKADQTPYRVYTPYFNRGCMLHGPMPRPPVAQPEIREFAKDDFGGDALASLDLLPAQAWHQTIMSHWQVSEDDAHQQLHAFLEHRLGEYKKGRDFPGQQAVSGLSPYLHWGQISPHQIWHQLHLWESDENLEHFKRELGWREFSYYQLYHFPKLPHTNLQTKFDHFPWLHSSPLLK
ncbi:MAG: deoxyribodipyrimidine photo-lyase, partial [Pseudomonadota bacterium]|nr:deoxyribodipyrimidine photo-lyase [Pseudomonadota bacterium]